jgi:hypothetical protein
MIPVTGHGGYVTFGATRYDIGKWTLNKDPRLVEVTTSATTGTRYIPVITDPSGTVELPWPSDNAPETQGFSEGAIVNMGLKLGNTTKTYALTATAIGPIEIEDDNSKDAVRARFSFKGGDITGPA